MWFEYWGRFVFVGIIFSVIWWTDEVDGFSVRELLQSGEGEKQLLAERRTKAIKLWLFYMPWSRGGRWCLRSLVPHQEMRAQ